MNQHVASLERHLREGRLELALVDKESNWAAELHMTCKSIGLDRLIFVIAPYHPLAHRTISARNLENKTFITFSEGNNLRSYVRHDDNFAKTIHFIFNLLNRLVVFLVLFGFAFFIY